jgi:tetratricopeptide (TPR) repeat protein
MKRSCLLFTFGLAPLWGQTPASYSDLEIVYRLEAGPRLTETRTGLIRLNSALLAPALRRVVLPRLSANGRPELRDLGLMRDGREVPFAAPSMQTTRGSFVWDVAEAQAGDEIRFSTAQPVDFTVEAAGAWWYANSTTLPLPVEHGLVRLVVPAAFAGSVDSIDPRNLGGGYEWRLDGITTNTNAALFVASSFRSWQDFSSWALARCPAEGGSGVAALTASRKVADVAARLSERLTVTDPIAFPCRPVEQVLASGTASPLEAATVFAAALTSIQIPVDRLLLSGTAAPEAVNPAAFQGAIIRVRSPDGTQWFDASHLERVSGGLRLTSGTESALPVQSADARWLAPLASRPEVRVESGRLDARVEAAITESGTLQGTVTMEANGAAESVLSAGSNQVASFLKERRVAAQPESTTAPGRMTRRVVIREDQFVIPLERVKQTPLNAVSLAPEPVRLSDGGLYLGAPGVYREQIDVGTAANRGIKANLHLDVDRPFAHYRSEANVLDGRLVITRELDLRSASVAAGDAGSAQSLVAQIHEDQERPFALARLGEVDWKAWTDSISPQQLDELAYKAYFPNGEYEAALLLLERSTQVNTRSAYAWGLTATIRMLLGQRHAAKVAYEKQLELDPGNTAARQALDNLLVPLGEADKVIESARGRLAANSKDAVALGSLEYALMRTHRWAEAEEVATRRMETFTDPATRSAARALPLTMQACQGKLANPGADLDAVLGPNPSPIGLSAIVENLVDCGKELELADGYCQKFLELMERFVPATTTSLISLTAFPQTYSFGLSVCGYLKIKMGDVEAGLERIRAANLILQRNPPESLAAQALWDAGHREEAEKIWIEAVSVESDALEQVPQVIRERVRAAKPGIIFPGWIPVPDATELVKGKVEPGEELFFLVRADEFGVVSRAFDLNVVPAAPIQLALRGMKVPVIPINSRTIPSVHVIMVRNTHGKVEVFRSFTSATIRMVQSMRLDLFRPAQQAVR